MNLTWTGDMTPIGGSETLLAIYERSLACKNWPGRCGVNSPYSSRVLGHR